MKIIFFKYILSQEENSLIYRFLIAQKNDFKRGDWYSEVRNILEEFEINMTDEEIQAKPDSLFKDLVKEKTFLAALKYLKMKQSKGKKDQPLITIQLNFKTSWAPMPT